MGNMNKIEILPSNRVRVGGGAVLIKVIEQLREKQRALVNNPWWVFGSVAGAISAESHWSWLSEAGSISSTVEELTLVKADGTPQTVSRAEHPDLMKYVSISAGKLGVIVEAVLRTVPDECFTLTTWYSDTYKDFEDARSNFISQGKEIWAFTTTPGYRYATDPRTKKPLSQQPWMISTREKTSCEPASCCHNAKCEQEGNWWEQKPMPLQVGCLKRSHVHDFPGFVKEDNLDFIRGNTNDDFELVVPLNKALPCLKALSEADGADELLKSPSKPEPGNPGFVSEMHARFIKADDAYLSTTGGVDAAGINFDSGFRFRSPSGKNCEQWKQFWDIGYGPTCSGKMHWGKAGYQHYSSDQTKQIFGEPLRTFKQKMMEWDPDGKFWRGHPTFDESAQPLETSDATSWHDCTSIFQGVHAWDP
jgi:hypothetical protein